MGIPLGFVSLRATTPKKLVLDGGLAWANANPTELRSNGFAAAINPSNTWAHPVTGATLTPTGLGAARDDMLIDPRKATRQVDVNGPRVPIQGLDRVTSMAPMIAMTLLEVADDELAQIILASVDLTEHLGANYKEYTPRLIVEDGDYLGSLLVAGIQSDEDVSQPYVVLLDNPIVENNVPISLNDDNEVGARAEFGGRASLTAPNDVPLHYFIAQPDGSGS